VSVQDMLVITKALYRSFTVTLDQYSSGSLSVQSMSEMIDNNDSNNHANNDSNNSRNN